jgi:molecular chaperone DnaK (HSP70)
MTKFPPNPQPPAVARHQPRFIIGIDLGTTNSVVAFVDSSREDGSVEVLRIPQLTAPGTVEGRELLPSFLYIPAEAEFAAKALSLPWKNDPDVIVGTFAQQHGAEVPTRIVTSAKSWLSHSGVDRTAAILPWGSPEEVAKLSPVEVSARYLAHIGQAWNQAHKEAPIEEQEVLLTVPASFDAVARDLTVRAAREAGLPQVTILEEPQAAFYSWIDSRGDDWRAAVRLGDLVLVCDVGGGTTDLSLIAVRERDGELVLERVAVGDHILLGGDNMDLSLAYQIRQRLAEEGTKLDSWQFRGLIQGCREAKERLLTDGGTTSHVLSILGRGRKVVGGTLRTEIQHADVERSLIDGFFPRCKLDDRPESQRRTGLQELGLPYATDAAITRHLAHFLTRQHAADEKDSSGSAARPTAVLFNGGAMRATALRERLLDVVNGWFSAGGEGIRVLEGGDPERAVARGAAYYGLARRGRGVRIRGGTPRTYYIGIETTMPAVPGVRPPIKALCVVPRGLEEGSEVDLPAREFGLTVGQPAEFRFLNSATRREDEVGTLVESWDEEEIEESAPLETTLDWTEHEGTTVPVHLQARVNEVGVLELWCVSRDEKQRWKLEFNVRSAD